MSSIARWTYKNKATVKPLLSTDDWSGERVYGEPFEIACNWIADAKQERESGGQSGARGAEFISQHIIYTEDPRPKFMDMISLGDSGVWEEIRSRVDWEMALFADTPDYKLVT